MWWALYFTHAMFCMKGGLVLLCHNDVVAECCQICTPLLMLSAISDKLLIYMSQDMHISRQQHCAEHFPELHGNIAIHGFWRHGSRSILDICIMHTKADSNLN
jgi:hypothetical protein